MTDIFFSDLVADAAAGALVGYPIADSDLIDAGSEVLQAAGPALVAEVADREADAWQAKIATAANGYAVATLQVRVDTLRKLAQSMRA
jgi:hypothetical protein